MKRDFKIGLFLAVAMLIAAIFIFMVGDFGSIFKKPGSPYYLYFNSAAGLEKNTVVRMAGVKIGYVKSLGLKGTQAEIILSVNPEVKLRKGSKAGLASLGLLGEKYIEILPGAEQDYLKPGAVVTVIDSVSLDRLGTELVSIGSEIKETGKMLRDLLGDEETRGGLRTTLKNLSEFSSDLKDITAENKDPLGQTIRITSEAVTNFDNQVQLLSQSIDELVRLLKDVVSENRDNIKSNLDQIEELTKRTETSLISLEETLAKLQSDEGTLGRLINKPDLYHEAEDALNNIRKTLDPISSVRLSTGMSMEYFSGPELIRSSLAMTFWPRDSRFMTAGIIRDPWKKKFTFSLQGGMRIAGFSPRAGILESQIGIGIDAYFLNDKLTVSLDGYDFNRRPRPSFRIKTRYSPISSVYLLLGLEDFTLSKRREFFFGLGFGL